MRLRSGCAGFSVFGVQFSENRRRPTAGSICTRPDVVKEWSDVELARRWLMLCPERRDEKRQPLEPTEFEINSSAEHKLWLARRSHKAVLVHFADCLPPKLKRATTGIPDYFGWCDFSLQISPATIPASSHFAVLRCWRNRECWPLARCSSSVIAVVAKS